MKDFFYNINFNYRSLILAGLLVSGITACDQNDFENNDTQSDPEIPLSFGTFVTDVYAQDENEVCVLIDNLQLTPDELGDEQKLEQLLLP